MVGAWKLKEGMALNVTTYMEAVWYHCGSGDFWVEGTAVNMAVVLVHRYLWNLRNKVHRIPWLHAIGNSNRGIKDFILYTAIMFLRGAPCALAAGRELTGDCMRA